MIADTPHTFFVPESERLWHQTSLQTIGSMLHALEIVHPPPRIVPLSASDLLPYILSDKRCRKLYRKAAQKSRQNFREKIINEETVESDLHKIKTAEKKWLNHDPEMVRSVIKTVIITLLNQLTIPEIKRCIAARPI